MNRPSLLSVPGPDRQAAALAGDWAEVEECLRQALAELLQAVASPAGVSEAWARLPVRRLAKLARRWPDLGPTARQAAWDNLGRLLLRAAYAIRPYCRRCGECCRTGSPALLADEAALLQPGGPAHLKAYAIRTGEPVWEPWSGQAKPAEAELIKLVETDGACAFYRPQAGCAIYDGRPAQCRAQACWEEGRPAAFSGPFLHRGLALAGERRKLDYAVAHQARCPVKELLPLALAARSGSAEALARLEELVGFDLHLRGFALDRGELAAGELDLVLGRPVAVILVPLGLAWDPEAGALRVS